MIAFTSEKHSAVSGAKAGVKPGQGTYRQREIARVSSWRPHIHPSDLAELASLFRTMFCHRLGADIPGLTQSKCRCNSRNRTMSQCPRGNQRNITHDALVLLFQEAGLITRKEPLRCRCSGKESRSREVQQARGNREVDGMTFYPLVHEAYGRWPR